MHGDYGVHGGVHGDNCVNDCCDGDLNDDGGCEGGGDRGDCGDGDSDLGMNLNLWEMKMRDCGRLGLAVFPTSA